MNKKNTPDTVSSCKRTILSQSARSAAAPLTTILAIGSNQTDIQVSYTASRGNIFSFGRSVNREKKVYLTPKCCV
ncbi:hypothetical protein K2Q08_00945, partial [Patescibacteria group bacterium]|nr:hypothetical protein [Patescibacteria group bacterium]